MRTENRFISGLQLCKEEHGVIGVYCDWLDLALSLLPKISDSQTEGHGSEIQTSVFMYLYPNIPIAIDANPSRRIDTHGASATTTSSHPTRAELGSTRSHWNLAP